MRTLIFVFACFRVFIARTVPPSSYVYYPEEDYQHEEYNFPENGLDYEDHYDILRDVNSGTARSFGGLASPLPSIKPPGTQTGTARLIIGGGVGLVGTKTPSIESKAPGSPPSVTRPPNHTPPLITARPPSGQSNSPSESKGTPTASLNGSGEKLSPEGGTTLSGSGSKPQKNGESSPAPKIGGTSPSIGGSSPPSPRPTSAPVGGAMQVPLSSSSAPPVTGGLTPNTPAPPTKPSRDDLAKLNEIIDEMKKTALDNYNKSEEDPAVKNILDEFLVHQDKLVGVFNSMKT